jgi:3-hydroxyisobutyrate dehydrogenase-like beta-hydroxyacid dehydrogenase
MSVVAPGARIGFVGLGSLSQPMARALVRAGWSVAVLDTASEKAEPCVAERARPRSEASACSTPRSPGARSGRSPAS